MKPEQLEEWRESLRRGARRVNVNGCRIPPYMIEGMVHYIVDLVPPGDFLTAIFCNDFVEAVQRADLTNQRCLPAYAGFLFSCAPASPLKCWGSPENMKAWLEQER